MLLDVAKLLLDRDTRESVKELIAALRKKPEWQKDLVEMVERFARPEEHKARLFIRFAAEVLAQKGWPAARAGAAEFAIQELVDNAFLHGLVEGDNTSRIRIRAQLSNVWAICAISDNGPGFDLSGTLATQERGERRGLSRVRAIASRLVQSAPNTVEVLVECVPGQVTATEIGTAYVLMLKGELRHSSIDYKDELERLCAHVPRITRLVIDLTEATYLSSAGIRFLLMVWKRMSESGSTVAVVVKPNSGVREVLEIGRMFRVLPCVDSLSEALQQSGDQGS